MVNWCCRYYYDTETGFYYLQSRYYDPEICRFINADTFATTDIDGLLSTNMFSYCENNPVMGVDPTGEWVHVVVGGIVGALTSCVSGLIAGDSFKSILISTAFGAASGALSAALPGAGAAVDVVMNVAESIVKGCVEKKNAKTIYKDAFVGAIAGAVTGSINNPLASKEGVASARKFVKNLFGKKKGMHPKVKLSNKKFNKKFMRKVFTPSVISTSVDLIVGHGSNELQSKRL